MTDDGDPTTTGADASADAPADAPAGVPADAPAGVPADALTGVPADAPADARRPRILIVTGLSGAGRTTASNVIEDLGWFVIDNLPPTLIQRVSDLAFAPGSSVSRLALVADARGREFFAALVDTIRELRRSESDVRVLYLEADDEALVRRFEETRRRHPSAEGAGVLVGIRREREKLTELRGMADLIIDTSDLNVHELRERVVDVFDDASTAPLHIEVVSFGFKRGSPRDADLLVDVRFLPNPHWVEELRPFNGRDAAVRDYVFGQPTTGPFMRALTGLLDVVVPGYVREGKRYLTLAIGCTGGKHRSVAISDAVGEYLTHSTDLPVTVQHRDLGEE